MNVCVEILYDGLQDFYYEEDQLEEQNIYE